MEVSAFFQFEGKDDVTYTLTVGAGLTIIEALDVISEQLGEECVAMWLATSPDVRLDGEYFFIDYFEPDAVFVLRVKAKPIRVSALKAREARPIIEAMAPGDLCPAITDVMSKIGDLGLQAAHITTIVRRLTREPWALQDQDQVDQLGDDLGLLKRRLAEAGKSILLELLDKTVNELFPKVATGFGASLEAKWSAA